jgi:hypothetical protein
METKSAINFVSSDVSERKFLDLSAFRAFVKSTGFAQGYKKHVMTLLGHYYEKPLSTHPGYLNTREPQNLSYITERLRFWSDQIPICTPYTCTVQSMNGHAHFVECVNIKTWEVAWRMHPSVCTYNVVEQNLFNLSCTELMLNNSPTEHEFWYRSNPADYNDRRLELKESLTLTTSDESGVRRPCLLFRILPTNRKKDHDTYRDELIKRQTARKFRAKVCVIFRKNMRDRQNVRMLLTTGLAADKRKRPRHNSNEESKKTRSIRTRQEKEDAFLKRRALRLKRRAPRLTKTLSDVWNTWKQSDMDVYIPIHSDIILNSPIATPFETLNWMVIDHPWHLFMDGQIIMGCSKRVW